METIFSESNQEEFRDMLIQLNPIVPHYAGMFFYSLFQHYKYRDADTSMGNQVRLEFRGFHNVSEIAHLLSQAPPGHRRHGQSPGEIFRDFVDMHMKDVHFFFNLAYKTSGKFPEHEASMNMVQNGASIDDIIAQVRLEDQTRQTGPPAQVKTSQTGPPAEASKASGARE